MIPLEIGFLLRMLIRLLFQKRIHNPWCVQKDQIVETFLSFIVASTEILSSFILGLLRSQTKKCPVEDVQEDSMKETYL